jgi:uncharacterized protein YfaS (alpha-2-macroglobulin family)
MEQTASATYPNVLVAAYVRKARVASPQLLRRAERNAGIGYQKLLTFETRGGGFGWWARGDRVVWLSAYALQLLSDLAAVHPVDRRVIDRTRAWLLAGQAADGSWSDAGYPGPEGKLAVTAYVTWALLESSLRGPHWRGGREFQQLKRAIDRIAEDAARSDDVYVLALSANALAAWPRGDRRCQEGLDEVLRKLAAARQARPGKACCFPARGRSLSHATGASLTVETTALVALALRRSRRLAEVAGEARTYLVRSREGYGTWGSTQATILALRALVAEAQPAERPDVPFIIRVNGKEAARGAVTARNADLLQQFDLRAHLKPGRNEVTVEAKDTTDLTCQVVARHYLPWRNAPAAAHPALKLEVDYERVRVAVGERLAVRARLRYTSKEPTCMVMVELPIPPGFRADPDEFNRLVQGGAVAKVHLTARQATLYLGDVKPGVKTFNYGLRAQHPLAVSARAAVAYEYYTPAHRAETRPVLLVAEEGKQ